MRSLRVVLRDWLIKPSKAEAADLAAIVRALEAMPREIADEIEGVLERRDARREAVRRSVSGR